MTSGTTPCRSGASLRLGPAWAQSLRRVWALYSPAEVRAIQAVNRAESRGLLFGVGHHGGGHGSKQTFRARTAVVRRRVDHMVEASSRTPVLV